MTVFGRDSLITSFQALPFVPEWAATTLRVLAARQSKADDPFQRSGRETLLFRRQGHARERADRQDDALPAESERLGQRRQQQGRSTHRDTQPADDARTHELGKR